MTVTSLIEKKKKTIDFSPLLSGLGFDFVSLSSEQWQRNREPQLQRTPQNLSPELVILFSRTPTSIGPVPMAVASANADLPVKP